MTTFTLYWVAADKSATIDMGRFLSYDTAKADIPYAQDILERQCNDINTVADIRAGTWSIEENKS